jgi:putative ABC transport system ATP-binding protein
MTKVLVRLERVSRRFRVPDGWVTALAEANCEVSAGERIAVMGPSGSGKSTLMSLMAQLDLPTSDDISWPDLPPAADLRPRHIGLAFQTASLLPALTAAENVEVPLLVLGEKTEVRQKVMANLEFLGIGHLAHLLPEELSGGGAQRVAAARALVSLPELILADEPTGQLDRITGQFLVRKLIERSEETGAALLIATHDQDVARQMDVVWRLKFGTLEVG